LVLQVIGNFSFNPETGLGGQPVYRVLQIGQRLNRICHYLDRIINPRPMKIKG
jgi:hypothetical protein